MTRTRRLLAGGAALLTLTVVASACDSSPFAASIDGRVIKQTAFNAELRALAANPGYVQAASKYLRLTVAGSAPGTYSSAWTASVLTSVITDDVLHAHLAATGALPGAAQLDASRVVDEVVYGAAAWTAFSPAIQATLVQRDADLAVAQPDTTPAATVANVVAQIPTVLASRVCVRTVAVTSSALARSAVGRFDASPGSPADGGTVTCYSTVQLDQQGASFLDTVLGLKTGTATAVRTSYGYQVTGITSRTAIPAGDALGRAITVADELGRAAPPSVSALVARARIKVNPLYGTWGGSPSQGFAVRPPTAAS